MLQTHKSQKYVLLAVLVGIMLMTVLPLVISVPDGATVLSISNETKTATNSALINTSGGSITTMVLNSSTQNYRWKAYVGNVSGSLTLDDAEGYSIFDWSIASALGEVYATRSESTISWSTISCATSQNITNEEIAINHTANPSDNISTTFSTTVHDEFYVGNVQIAQNDCFSLHTYVNDSSQSTNFEEILLHDQTHMVYATIIEEDALGFNPNKTFDFQMIVPENGQPGWDSSTGYYFYVELT